MPKTTDCASKASTDAEPAAPEKKPACKACCACPETKRVRDDWYDLRLDKYIGKCDARDKPGIIS